MTKFTVEQIAKFTDAQIKGYANPLQFIQEFIFDSRKNPTSKQSMFIALVGGQRNGHDFIEPAYEKGVRCFLVSEAIQVEKYPDAQFLKVNHTLQALQSLAKNHRAKFDLPVIGITGSNGKTMIKEWLAGILQSSFHVTKSPKSFNSQLGVPLSLLALEENSEIGVFEAGISKPDEMNQLENMIKPNIGIFSHLGDAHDRGFKNQKEKLEEKLLLFKNCNTLIYPGNQELVVNMVEEKLPTLKQISWSIDASDSSSITILQKDLHKIQFVWEGQNIEFTLPFSDSVSKHNLIPCILCALVHKVNQETIQNQLNYLRPVSMRMEIREGRNGVSLINDSYNADLEALRAALDFMDQQGGAKKNSLILSAFNESGQDQNQINFRIQQLLEPQKLHRLLLVGDGLESFQGLEIAQELHFFSDTEHLISELDNLNFKDELVLLKGGRPFGFERIFDALASQAHDTVLHIDLSALQSNLKQMRQELSDATKIMAVIKAAAYGSGSKEIGRFLAAQGIDYIAVAYTDEGIELREAGVMSPIMVMNPEVSAFRKMIQFRLEPAFYTQQDLERFCKVLDAEKPYPIHIKINSGMNRLGFDLEDLPVLKEFISQNSSIQVQSIFSHLAAAGKSDHDDFTLKQIAKFEEGYEEFAQSLSTKPLKHILNSSGISRFSAYQFDMVRAGIGLYGVASESERKGLTKVHTLKVKIAQIRSVKKGETVGYDRKFKAEKDIKIGILHIGYADGLLRKAGNGQGFVMAKGVKFPFVGNICMDVSMINLSIGEDMMVGDYVEVFGNQVALEELASLCETIPYEIISRLSPRIKRIYSFE